MTWDFLHVPSQYARQKYCRGTTFPARVETRQSWMFIYICTSQNRTISKLYRKWSRKKERLFLLKSLQLIAHDSFPERLNFVSYHAIINLPHLIIGYNHQKVTWKQFLTDWYQGPVSRTLRVFARISSLLVSCFVVLQLLVTRDWHQNCMLNRKCPCIEAAGRPERDSARRVRETGPWSQSV